ncbi:uncharacterized protein LOC136024841 isoform X2 [Artemia franciscana]|uniref:uncharacterized protein LOC136024841 isoform X2 n=2 Tax=Artemia franciscana TaxID=6661 RepID=UPI0032DBDEB6
MGSEVKEENQIPEIFGILNSDFSQVVNYVEEKNDIIINESTNILTRTNQEECGAEKLETAAPNQNEVTKFLSHVTDSAKSDSITEQITNSLRDGEAALSEAASQNNPLLKLISLMESELDDDIKSIEDDLQKVSCYEKLENIVENMKSDAPFSLCEKEMSAGVLSSANMMDDIYMFLKTAASTDKLINASEEQVNTINRLIEDDPFVFFDRLQSMLFELGIEQRVKILNEVQPGEEFVMRLLRSFYHMVTFGEKLKPHIRSLESKFMREIDTSWDLVPKYFFFKCIYSEVRIRVLIMPSITDICKQENRTEFSHELYKLNNIMLDVSEKWKKTEDNLMIYHENQLAVKLRRKLLLEEYKKSEESIKALAVESSGKSNGKSSEEEDDIPKTLDYLISRPRGLACPNALLQESALEVCKKCGVSMCTCAECTVGHLLSCSLKFDVDDAPKEMSETQMDGKTVPLEEKNFPKINEKKSSEEEDDIPKTLDYLISRPRGLACPNALLQESALEVCKKCGVSMCTCAECTVGHLLSCSLKFDVDDAPKEMSETQMDGKTVPLEEKNFPKINEKWKPRLAAELADLLKQIHLAESEETESEKSTLSSKTEEEKPHSEKKQVISETKPESLVNLATQKFQEVQKSKDIFKFGYASTKPDSKETKTEACSTAHLPKGAPNRPKSEMPDSSPNHNAGSSCMSSHLGCKHDASPSCGSSHSGGSDDSDTDTIEMKKGHCDCCHHDGTSVIRNAAMARRYPAIRQRLRSVLERRKAEKVAEQQLTKEKTVQNTAARPSAKPPVFAEKSPVSKPVNHVKGTPQAVPVEAPQKSRPSAQVKAQIQRESKPPQQRSVTAQSKTTAPTQSILRTPSNVQTGPRPQSKTTAPAQSVRKTSNVLSAAPPQSKTTVPAQSVRKAPSNVQTVTPPQAISDQRSAKIAELSKINAKQQSKGVEPSKPVGKKVGGKPTVVQAVSKETKAEEKEALSKKLEEVTKKAEGLLKAKAVLPKQGVGSKKKEKKGGKPKKEPPPPPVIPEPKPKSEIDQILEYIEGDEEKPKEVKPQYVESANEKKAAKKARQKERKQAEFIAKQTDTIQEKPSQQSEMNGMVRIVHDPVTQRAIITPVQHGYPPVPPQHTYPYMPMPGGPMYNQYPQGQYPGHGYYPPMYPPMYPGMQQQGYGYQQPQANGYQPPQNNPVYPQPTQQAAAPTPAVPASSTDTQNKPQGPMVTLRRVVDNGPESKVTVTLRGEQPDRDKVLFTLVNGQVHEPKEGEKSIPTSSEPLTKTAKKKLKKAKKEEQKQPEPTPEKRQLPHAPPPQMLPQYPQYPPFQPQMMPIFPMQQPPLQPIIQKPQPVPMQKPKTTPFLRPKIQTAPLDDDEDFDIKSLKLPPGITVTRVLHQENQRDPIFPQVSQIQKPSAVVQPSPQPNVIVVDTSEMTKNDQQGRQNDGTTATKKKKKKKSGKKTSDQPGEETWDADSIFKPKENPSELFLHIIFAYTSINCTTTRSFIFIIVDTCIDVPKKYLKY